MNDVLDTVDAYAAMRVLQIDINDTAVTTSNNLGKIIAEASSGNPNIYPHRLICIGTD